MADLAGVRAAGGCAATVVLIDGSSLVYRAFFAIPSTFCTAAGLPTNAIYGVALMFSSVFAGRTPTYGAVVFDAPGRTFRDDAYSAYKAQRPRMDDDLRRQLPSVHKLVATWGFPILAVPGFEADDVIGTLTRMSVEAGHEVRIISGDKDFAQLITDRVRMVDTMRQVSYEPGLVWRKWVVKPEQFVDYLALVGDRVDNIPGVTGVGAKQAAALLGRFGSLDGIYDHLDDLTPGQRRTFEDQRDQALLSRSLATIDQHVPLDVAVEQLRIPETDPVRINTLYRELEFFSLLSDEERQSIATETAHRVCRNVADVQSMVDEIEGLAALVLITDVPERSGSTSILHGLTGLAIAWENGAAYVPLYGAEGSLDDAGLEAIKPWLCDPNALKVVHSLRTVHTVLRCYGVDLRGVIGDSALGSFLVDPTKLIPHRLDQVVKGFLQRTVPSRAHVLGSGRKKKAFAQLTIEDTAAYGGLLASSLFELWPVMHRELCERKQLDHLQSIDMPLAVVLGEMQLRGIEVDPDHLATLEREFQVRLEEVERQITALAGHPFNVGSTRQLGTVLFEELGLPVIKRTKTGYSTAADVLDKLAHRHEIIGHIVQWRALSKLINTYTKVLRTSVVKETGRVHAIFQQTHSASGRLITTDPDLQRTPIHTTDGKRIREAFVAKPGSMIISADWSQVELRILADVSGDPLLVSSFMEGVDVHRRTASQIFDVAPEAVTQEQRNTGKTVNFATIYGQGASALGQQLGLGRADAQRLIDAYFHTYKGVRDWVNRNVGDAHERGYVTTMLGRRRTIEELSSRTWSEKAYGERIAANTPIQGSAADLCKVAMLLVAHELVRAGMKTRMVLQIHDELLFEAPLEEVQPAVALIKHVMENAVKLSVPLVVDVGVGDTWARAH